MKYIYLQFLFSTTISFVNAQELYLDSIVRIDNDKEIYISIKNNISNKEYLLTEYKREDSISKIEKIKKSKTEYTNYKKRDKTTISYWDKIHDNWINKEMIKNINTKNSFLTITQNWDSIHTTWKTKKIDKTIYKDKDEYIIKLIESKYKKDNKWFLERKIVTKEKKNNTTTIYYIQEGNKQKPYIKDIIKTNSNNKLEYSYSQEWNDKKRKWENMYMSVYTYQHDTIITSKEAFEWENNKWEKASKIIYNLNNSNTKFTNTYSIYKGDNKGFDNYILYKSIDDKWIPEEKYEEIEYPEEMKKVDQSFSWNEYDNNWNITNREEYFLNENGKESKIYYYNLNDTTNQLELSTSYLYTYDKKNREILKHTISSGNGQNSETKYIHQYDDKGNLTKIQEFEFTSNNRTWRQTYLLELFYNLNILSYSLNNNSLKQYDSDMFNHENIKNPNLLIGIKEYRFENNEKIQTKEEKYFYKINT